MNKMKSMEQKILPSKKERHKIFGSVQPGPKTKPTVKEQMVDLQNLNKDFLFDIDAVGISNVKYPIIINSELQPKVQSTVGTFKLTSNIDRMSKGTNMSRFLEEIEQSSQDGFHVSFSSLQQFTINLKNRLQQETAMIEVSFPWFYERLGPDSNKRGLNHADVLLKVSYHKDGTFTFAGKLSTVITTLCPCSKEISEYSAHSQRGIVTMEVQFTNDIVDESIDWKQVLLQAAESNASAKVHPVLKRTDEKQVTETAYENPRFVEDIVRLVAADLYEVPYISQFKVNCRNEESIHMHDAIATIEFNKENDSLK